MNKENSKRITVMHLRSSHQSSPVLFGGEKIVLSICRLINKNFFEPVLGVIKDSRAKGELPLIERACNYRIKTEIIFLKYPFNFVSALLQLKQLLKKYKVDILHSHEYKSNLIAFSATVFNKKVKLITTLHGWTKGNIKLRFYEFFDSIIVRRFHKIIVVSEAMRKMLLKKGYSPLKIFFIPNALDLDNFRKDVNTSNIKKSLGIEQEALIIGTVGRLSQEKGHYYLLMAAQRIINLFPNVVFLIVGDGPLRIKLEKLVSKLGIKNKVIFAGFRNDVDRLLAVMDIFVMPSIREAFGLSMLEAMAAGRAVIATNVGGIPFIIKDGQNGRLVESQDDSALAKAIIKLLEDENSRRQLGEKAKSFIRNKFSVNKMAKDYENVYLEIVDK